MRKSGKHDPFTGNDVEGQDELGNFTDPESRYPVLVTTSRLLSTGVDVQTCRLIVLDREVGSMTEFKQIVGRGTRVHEDTRKYYFTLMDFRGATGHFADPAFDGEPVQIYEPKEGDPMDPPDAPPAHDDDGPVPANPDEGETVVDEPGLPPTVVGPRKKVYVDGIAAAIVAERIEYLDEHGKLVTESLHDYTRKVLRKSFASLDDFLRRWDAADRKQAAGHEGLLLDPVYTGKVMAGLIAHVRSGRIAPGGRALFVHTGGQPALFAYAESLGPWLSEAPGR